jgi:Icc-related predicted phosphoesterase
MIIADDEAFFEKLQRPEKPIDVLISCGDLSDQVILETARRVGCDRILAVKGNHDSSSDFPPQIKDLHMETATVEGLKFGGFAGAWKYKPKGNFLFEQAEVNSMLSWFPSVDVFVAHNSPRGIHDREDEVHLGFDAFNRYIDRVKPKFFVHGHQHVSAETDVGSTKVIGTYGSRILELTSEAGQTI